jgi:hypothetical protein
LLRLVVGGCVCLASCGAFGTGAAFGDTATFNSTGAEQTFTVPVGVSTVHVVAVGGRGGTGGLATDVGGFGAIATADLPVSAGQVLYVEVAGNGAAGYTSSGSTVPGGFNGGGTGGINGGGGGGASDVRTAPAAVADSLASRLIVAGGGGGGTGVDSPGGNAGAPGQDGVGSGFGGAGSATAGGAGGPPNGEEAGGGFPGVLGAGGAGGYGRYGGGGGGGLYGGGGGGGGGTQCAGGGCDYYFGSGGGGGSSGFAMSAENTSVGTDTTGIPSVTFTYVAAPSNVSPPTVSGAGTVGMTLSASTGMWSGSAPLSYAYQWQRCRATCASIAGATQNSYTLTGSDRGASILVVVTASNAAGSAPTNSAMVGPVAANVAEIRKSLSAHVVPSGSAARITTILKNGGFAERFTALAAGTATISWYGVPPSAQAAAAKAVLVATGSHIFHKAGTGTVAIRLTTRGRQLLMHATSVKLTAKGTFNAPGEPAITTKKAFTLQG